MMFFKKRNKNATPTFSVSTIKLIDELGKTIWEESCEYHEELAQFFDDNNQVYNNSKLFIKTCAYNFATKTVKLAAKYNEDIYMNVLKILNINFYEYFDERTNDKKQKEAVKVFFDQSFDEMMKFLKGEKTNSFDGISIENLPENSILHNPLYALVRNFQISVQETIISSAFFTAGLTEYIVKWLV